MTDNLFKQPAYVGWADRILNQIKVAGQSTEKPYVFLTSCVESTPEDINALTDLAVECSLEEVAHNCDLTAFKEALGYSIALEDEGLPLEKDCYVTYWRSYYKGVACYVVDHSRIEYIWVNTRNWHAERVMSALDKAGIEVDLPRG